MRPVELTVWKDGRPCGRLALRKGIFRLGRSPDNDVVLPSPVVSREHARLFVHDDGVYIVDSESQNGILSGGARVDMRHVYAGDVVCIEPFVMEFSRTKREVDGGHVDAAQLVGVEGSFSRSHITLMSGRNSIGSGFEADLMVPDPQVADEHAEIVTIGGTYLVRDLGSGMGTYVNGRPIREACLAQGDLLRFGSTVYRFEVTGLQADDPLLPIGDLGDQTVPISF